MTSKNPFEVRLDVLKMAQEMLETEQRTQQMKFKEKVETMRSSQQVPTDVILSYIDENAPKSYSADDVVARSSALYNFVTDKSK
jgi:hypothetical protein